MDALSLLLRVKGNDTIPFSEVLDLVGAEHVQVSKSGKAVLIYDGEPQPLTVAIVQANQGSQDESEAWLRANWDDLILMQYSYYGDEKDQRAVITVPGNGEPTSKEASRNLLAKTAAKSAA
jgi:hypothetical protein